MGKIATINVPKSFCEAIDKLVKLDFYESRSEFIRKALLEEMREYLTILDNHKSLNPGETESSVPDNIVQITYTNEKGEEIIEEHKVLRKLV